MKARICIAEDVQLFREGLVNLINQQPDLEIVGEAEDGLEILSVARDLKPDLILMDINMPVCDGIEATALVHEILPDVTILILTTIEDDEKLLEAVKVGASGYLLKSASAEGLLRSIRSALDGEAILPRKMSIRLLEAYVAAEKELITKTPDYKSPTITFREIEVLRFIARGLTNQEIADSMNVSIYTIKSHVRNLIDKLGVKNRWDAVSIAKQHGFIHIEPGTPEHS
jgi:two-component system NarL family response regulator